MALKDLQRKIGVKDDGVFGPKTLKAAAEYFELSNERAAHFFGQCSHETGNFARFHENLNYSVSGLNRVFKKYFPNDLAEEYARKPIKIASRVYANRMGNGDEESQDGWKFRGRGAIQTTGRNNYQQLSDYLEMPEIMENPDLVTTDFAFEAALFYFEKRKLWDIADNGVNTKTITRITRLVNGGFNGLQDRIKKTNQYYKWLES